MNQKICLKPETSKIAKESFPYLIGSIGLAILFSKISLFLSAPFLVAAAIVLFFFRDPKRVVILDDKAILSPADGTVKEISFDGSTCRVWIYLSFLDVHINRAPVSGHVTDIRYTPGQFLMAYDQKASLQNESNLIMIHSNNTEFGVRQIAGKIARRIVCYLKKGDTVRQGQKIGLIQFGSGMHVYFPKDAEIKVAVGQKVVGAVTVIAKIK